MDDALKILEEVTISLLQTAATRLQPDVKETLKKAYNLESSLNGKVELKNILDDIEAAEEINKPLCQDTGIISFYLKSRRFENTAKIQETLEMATMKPTTLCRFDLTQFIQSPERTAETM